MDFELETKFLFEENVKMRSFLKSYNSVSDLLNFLPCTCKKGHFDEEFETFGLEISFVS